MKGHRESESGTRKLRFRGHDLIVVGVRMGMGINFHNLQYTYALTRYLKGLQLPHVTSSVSIVIVVILTFTASTCLKPMIVVRPTTQPET